MRYYLGLDVGATNIRCLVVDDERRVVARDTQPTPQRTTASEFAVSAGRAVDATLSTGGLGPGDIAAVGIGSFGPIDTTAGTITETPNLEADVTGIPLRETVARRFPKSVPTTLLNDADAGVVAEHELGGDDENVVYLTLSSGIGAGAVVDGSLLQGRAGNAAEVGHLMLQSESDRECGCGASGHWEAFASGENIPEYARDIAAKDDIRTDLPLGEENLSAGAVFDRYGDDPLATELVDRVGTWNAIGVANLAHAFAPDRVAIGGALARHNPTLVFEPLARSFTDHLLVQPPEIHLTNFGDDVVALGAIEHAVTNLD